MTFPVDLLNPNIPEGPWISLGNAFAQIRQVHVGRDISLKVLRDAIVSGKLRTMAKLVDGIRRGYISQDTTIRETYLPPESWIETNFTVSTLDETVVRVVVPRLAIIGGSWYIYIQDSDLSALLGRNEVQPKTQPKKGGRPEEHSWAAAFAYFGWVTSRNGLPEKKSAAVELIRDWFVKNEGSAPKDDRELARRVAQAYEALARIQSAEGDGGEV